MSESEVRTLNKKVDKIILILQNDDETDKKGLVSEFIDLKRSFYVFVNQYNIDQALKKGKDTVWKIVWGAVGASIITLGKFFIGLFLKA